MRDGIRIFIVAALLLSLAVITAAQNEPLAFEVASIKPSKPGSLVVGGMRPLPGGQTYVAGGIPVRLMIKTMYRVDIQTGARVVIPKGSHKAIRVLHRTARDAPEEPRLVVTVQHRGKPVSAGLREAYCRQWEGHHIPEFRVTIEEWKENVPPSTRKTRP